jgi:predicted glycoside hydrolase/deacetylase ChbG (UPF0249 family)
MVFVVKSKTIVCCLSAVFLAIVPVWIWFASDNAKARSTEGEIRLIARADDIGSCHAANEACIKSYREGIVRTVEVMVPGPWFNEAVKMLRENPGLDVGVHLTLTSEWEFYKWGPITETQSLVDEQGHFYPMTSQRNNFPPNTGFLEANPNIEEIEKELRAQIELATKKISNVSHLTCHMGTAVSTPGLRAMVQKLSQEYKLPLEAPPTVKTAGDFGDSNATAHEREAALAKMLEKLGPGTWLLVEHPGLDTPEMRAMGHIGYWNVAAHRDGVTKTFTSQNIKRIIEKRGIKLISYHDLQAD